MRKKKQEEATFCTELHNVPTKTFNQTIKRSPKGPINNLVYVQAFSSPIMTLGIITYAFCKNTREITKFLI